MQVKPDGKFKLTDNILGVCRHCLIQIGSFGGGFMQGKCLVRHWDIP